MAAAAAPATKRWCEMGQLHPHGDSPSMTGRAQIGCETTDFASLVQSWVGERVASHRIADHKAHLATCDGRDETASRPPTLGIEA